MQEIWSTSEVLGWGEGKKVTQRFPWPSFQRRSPFSWRDAFFPSSVQCGFGFIHIGNFNFFTCCQTLPYAANLIFHAPPIFSWKTGGRQRWPLQVSRSEGMHCLRANSLWGSESLLFALLSQGTLPSAVQNCENKSELVLCLQTPRLSVGLWCRECRHPCCTGRLNVSSSQKWVW